MKQSRGSDAERAVARWALSALLLVTGVVYVRTLSGGFVFDDEILIRGNRDLQQLSLDSVERLFYGPMFAREGAFRFASYYRPITMLSYAIDQYVGGGGAASFRLTNLGLHLVATSLVWRFLLRHLGDFLPALLGATWFALHPARAETVAWISGRPDSLCLVLLLGSLELLALERPRVWSRLGAGVLALAALLSKETAVILPCLVGFEVWSRRGRATALIRAPEVWASFVLVSVYWGLRAVLLPLDTELGSQVPASARAGLFLETMGRDFEYLLSPRDLSLFAASRVTTEAGEQFHGGYALIGGLGLLGLIGLIVHLRRSQQVRALVLFVLCIAPVSNLLLMPAPILTSPRLTYIPGIFVALSIAEAVHFLSKRFALRQRVLWSITVCLAGVWGLLATVWASHFHDSPAFWHGEFEANPDNPAPVGKAAREDLVHHKCQSEN